MHLNAKELAPAATKIGYRKFANNVTDYQMAGF